MEGDGLGEVGRAQTRVHGHFLPQRGREGLAPRHGGHDPRRPPQGGAARHLRGSQADGARDTAVVLHLVSEAGVEEATRDRLMGHAPATVAERHYTSTILTKLRDAVESIKLELTMGQIIALPMRAVASGETASEPGSEAASEPAQAAGLTAARGKPAASVLESEAVSSTPGRTRTCDPRLRRPDTDGCTEVHDGANGLESGAEDTAERAPECTNGAVSDDRGKLRGKAAVSVQRAIDLLNSGDLDGARNVLADLLGWP